MSRRAGFFAKRSPPPEPEAGDRVRTAGWARNCPWNRGPCSGRRTDSGSGPRARYSPGASCLSLPFKSLRFAAAAQQRGGVVLQISHGVDPIGAGTEPVLQHGREGRRNSAWPPVPGGTGRTDRGTAMDITSPLSMDPPREDYSGDGIFFRSAPGGGGQGRNILPPRRFSRALRLLRCRKFWMKTLCFLHKEAGKPRRKGVFAVNVVKMFKNECLELWKVREIKFML